MVCTNLSSSTVVSIFFFLFIGFTSSSFISDGVLDSHGSTGRSLLQAKKSCPVNLEFANYTIITSQCKGPLYPPKLCCAAFVEFACPYAQYLNDLTNDCATIMFSYINLYGKYPPGLFANQCRGGKEGLECPAPAPGESADVSNSGQTGHMVSPFLITAGFLLLLSRIF